MTLKGKVIVDAKYEKVEIRDGGIAMVTDITGIHVYMPNKMIFPVLRKQSPGFTVWLLFYPDMVILSI